MKNFNIILFSLLLIACSKEPPTTNTNYDVDCACGSVNVTNRSGVWTGNGAIWTTEFEVTNYCSGQTSTYVKKDATLRAEGYSTANFTEYCVE